MKEPMYRTTLVITCLIAAWASIASAQEPEVGKNTSASTNQVVAAGIALKTEFILTSPFSPLSNGDFAGLAKSLDTISNDADSFSDTESGKKMRLGAIRIASLLKLILTEKIPTENKEFLEFIKQNEIDGGTPDPSRIVGALHNEVRRYVRECDLPVSILHFKPKGDPAKNNKKQSVERGQ